jgi:hypothetical protein
MNTCIFKGLLGHKNPAPNYYLARSLAPPLPAATFKNGSIKLLKGECAGNIYLAIDTRYMHVSY